VSSDRFLSSRFSGFSRDVRQPPRIPAGPGLRLLSCDGVAVRNLRIVGSAEKGVVVGSSLGNRIDGAEDEGIIVHGEHALIADNVVRHAAFSGVYLQGNADGTSVLENDVGEIPMASAIYVAADHAHVAGNHVRSVGHHGVSISTGAVSGTVRENRIRKTGGHGIVVAGAVHRNSRASRIGVLTPVYLSFPKNSQPSVPAALPRPDSRKSVNTTERIGKLASEATSLNQLLREPPDPYSPSGDEPGSPTKTNGAQWKADG